LRDALDPRLRTSVGLSLWRRAMDAMVTRGKGSRRSTALGEGAVEGHLERGGGER